MFELGTLSPKPIPMDESSRTLTQILSILYGHGQDGVLGTNLEDYILLVRSVDKYDWLHVSAYLRFAIRDLLDNSTTAGIARQAFMLAAKVDDVSLARVCLRAFGPSDRPLGWDSNTAKAIGFRYYFALISACDKASITIACPYDPNGQRHLVAASWQHIAMHFQPEPMED
jgi:hypothetical protein